jgi:hypothetical protein
MRVEKIDSERPEGAKADYLEKCLSESEGRVHLGGRSRVTGAHTYFRDKAHRLYYLLY